MGSLRHPWEGGPVDLQEARDDRGACARNCNVLFTFAAFPELAAFPAPATFPILSTVVFGKRVAPKGRGRGACGRGD